MEAIQIQFSQLEKKLLDIVEENQKLYKEQQMMADKIDLNEKKERELTQKIHVLEQENKNLKVANAFTGNKEYRKLMKLQLNKLINEVDLCIAQVKSN